MAELKKHLKFGANLAWLFVEYEESVRPLQAGKAGFDYAEYSWFNSVNAAGIRKNADKAKVEIVLCNADMGDLVTGGPGLSAHPNKIKEFRATFSTLIENVKTLGCRYVNIGPFRLTDEMDRGNAIKTLRENLIILAEMLAPFEAKVLLEPLNRKDNPSILVHDVNSALQIIESCNHPNIGLQFDIYHIWPTLEEPFMWVSDNLERISHIQFADSPGRNEPGTGLIPFEEIFKHLEHCGYEGILSAEYRPLTTTHKSLSWLNSVSETLT